MGTNIAACQKQQLYEGSIKILNPQITISRETQWVSRGISIHVGICSQYVKTQNRNDQPCWINMCFCKASGRLGWQCLILLFPKSGNLKGSIFLNLNQRFNNGQFAMFLSLHLFWTMVHHKSPLFLNESHPPNTS